MTLLEAMAIGTPVLAHGIGGIPNVCQHGKSCHLVSRNNVEDYVKKIKSIFDEPQQLAKTARQAQKHIESNYSSQVNAENYKAIYRSLT